MSTNTEESLLNSAKLLVPSLSEPKHKGQDGRIGIVGGSLEYSGAPFFAGISALRTGADLVHIFCCKEASIPIKSFSPELIVHPVLDDLNGLNLIEPWLERLHVILIGPGLGRDDQVFQTVSKLITKCKKLLKPLVIDADGLFLVGKNPELIKNYPGLVLTPNAMEFSRLVKAIIHKDMTPSPIVEDKIIKELAEAIGEQVIVVQKGSSDAIANGSKSTDPIHCSISGSGRRCGGQGDLLSGAISIFTCWSKGRTPNTNDPISPAMLACYAACRLVRECNAEAFKVKRRGMLASDMIEAIAPTFYRLFEKV
ncbi:ATP-dependent (S)-NAD(P)H-hydrate dehydratase [Phymastichus coffea]|uniref:ATP-dependent (S)-NAD(P)H-hydrate dehydratase n=1 Tax=Phymastichus coffea TaxID=108790 RepID=UPI00273AFC58|nr:ATP-dependent (S)-NAD(P)H-hydrate dehydratase [Phymastichus coffea]